MIKSYSVTADYNGLRLDRCFRKNILNIPQGLIEKLLRIGKIKVNKRKVKSSYKLKKGDLIECFNLNYKNKIIVKNSYNPNNKIIKYNEETVIHNNENFIVINKRPGISVQSGTKSHRNLVDIFAKSFFFSDTKPYTVHRIDKETSGIFLIAKNRMTAQFLTSLFRLRKIHKTYLAICNGILDKKKGILKNNLKRFDNNKEIIEEAITKYKVIDHNLNLSLLELSPITGRKHQLRKQLFQIGHPIVGDNKYSFTKKNSKSLMLHAYTIKFKKNNDKFNFKANIPDHFNKYLKQKKLYLKTSDKIFN